MSATPHSASLRTRLRTALNAAMKRRDAAAISALRSALAAIDKAEAVDAAHAPAAGNTIIAGAVDGLRAGEVPRRQLDEHALAAIVRAEIAHRLEAAAEYERLGQGDQAVRLRAEASVLARQLDERNHTLVRPATPDDAALLSEMGARIFVETFGPASEAEAIRGYVAEAFSISRIRAELAESSSFTLIAEVDGAAVGYARLSGGEAPAQIAGPAPVELVRLYVEGAYHGSGVAARLMQASIDAARQRGYATMYLGVWEHNPRAQAFYRKWGFERCGEHDFQLGDETQTDWLMARSL